MRRKLAVYKIDGSNFTIEEEDKVAVYCENHAGINSNKKWIFDDFSQSFMGGWNAQKTHNHFKKCKQISFTELFKIKTTLVTTLDYKLL
ncbi:MAG: hypothetical protein KAI79_02340 [Bacteroidales bacterium]|nr:hypothetical protein [Bacteroidales bacterium]